MSDSNEPAGAPGPDTPAQNEQPQNSPTPAPQPEAKPAEQAEPETSPPQDPPQDATPAPAASNADNAPSEDLAEAPAQSDPTEPQADAPKEPEPATESEPEAPKEPESATESEPESETESKPETPQEPQAAKEPETESPQEPEAGKKTDGETEKKPAPPAGTPKGKGQKAQGKSGGGPKQSKPGQSGKSQPRGRSAGPAAPRRRPGKPPKGPSVVIRYGIMAHLGQFRHNLTPPPARGVNVVIRTDRGVELGEVMTVVADDAGDGQITPARLEEHIRANGPDYPFRRDGKILRLANPQDLIDQRHLNSSATDERKFCAQEIKDMKLDMKLVAVEHLLGGERIIFYFLAEHRVDFRDLVHKLASQYHTRIEMRQVGARDEARLVGDYERCGQECCCKQFLKGLQPVSMRMAKTQKATLDPSKISGRCGRLMCCLRYEDQTYRDLKKCLPHKNIWVKTSDKIGRVTGTQILTQLVQVQLPDGSRGVFANEDIIERNVDPPKPPEPSTRSSRPPRQSDRNKPDRGRGGKQGAQPDRQKDKPDGDKRQPKPPRKARPKPEPKPKSEAKPRATAEALDPAWGAVLGDGVAQGDTPAAVPPKSESPEAPQTEPKAGDSQQSAKPESKDGDGAKGGKPPASGERRRKRRRRRGRKPKGKKQDG